MQHLSDEAHRFAITFHRKRRSKRIIKSELTDIKGIGTETAKILLENFGSVETIKKTSKDELAKIIGIKKAELIANQFND